MNEAKAKLDAGNLDEAIQETLNVVKSKPTDIVARTFLFELSCFSGDWERAEKQLDVIGKQDINAMIGSQIYKQNFKAERDRIRCFSESLIPECLMPPPPYVEDLLHANNRIREGNIAEAREILDKVDETRPRFACTINGEEFSDFRDYNDLTMCVFETLVKDSYTWVPFEQVERVVFTKPKTMRDLYWAQAEVEMINGTKGEMFLPTLYVNSHESENDQIRLGRMTDWKDLGEDLYIGEGMRMFWHDGSYRSILEMEEIKFTHEPAE
jgi:type VI secretion system protein ImpE